MTFSSIQFMFFFPVAFLIYLVIPRKIRCMFLLCVSYIYYTCYLNIMYGHTYYIFCLIAATLFTYFIALRIEKLKKKNFSMKKEKIIKFFLVFLAVLINIGMLVFFKYNILKIKDILLPIGLSYYIFSSLGYVIDVSKGTCEAEKDIFKYGLYVSFFPVIFSGPIERSTNLLKQIKEIEYRRVWSYENFSSGLILMLWGYFQKFVIVTRCSIFVDAIFDNYLKYGTVECVLAVLIYAFQIYLDFMSYSLIAMGVAKFFSFNVIDNFKTPYLATSIKAFWRRWHISLTSWFRDYVYIPLGGNRCGIIRKNLNIIIVFALSGMWHGATYNFLIWGLLHGIYQVIESIIAPIKKFFERVFKVNTTCFSYNFGEIIVTFFLVDFAWIFFRCETYESAIGFIKQMFTRFNPWVLFDKSLYDISLQENEMSILLWGLLIVILVDIVRFMTNKSFDEFLKQQNLWFEWIVLLLLLVFTLVFGYYGAEFNPQDFIYFQF